jgi:hypothetical protein
MYSARICVDDKRATILWARKFSRTSHHIVRLFLTGDKAECKLILSAHSRTPDWVMRFFYT